MIRKGQEAKERRVNVSLLDSYDVIVIMRDIPYYEHGLTFQIFLSPVRIICIRGLF